MKEIDLKIIQELQNDSRKSYREIANSIGVATGTVCNRIKTLTDAGILKGYTTVVDPAKVGYGLTALILIQAEGEHLVDVEEEIAKSGNVLCVYDITGDFDAAILARFKDGDRMNRFIKRLIAMPYVKRTVTSFVLNIVKEDLRGIPLIHK
ncbi:MAG: Lrp/AsnC family transcriptional regulator [Candidatus Bathyarchaeia archaeon]